MTEKEATQIFNDERRRPRGKFQLGPKTRRIVVILLWLYGIELWLISGRGYWGHNRQIIGLAVAIAIACVPAVNGFVGRGLDAIRTFANRFKTLSMLLVGVAAVVMLYTGAVSRHATFAPQWHDEFSYLLQMHLLAHGRLWMPPHPLGRFFDSFYLIQQPVYASMYFPGTALMFVPTIWLGLPKFVGPLLASGALVALIFGVVSEIYDGLLGLFAALLLLSVRIFRTLSIMLLSQDAMLPLGLLMVLSFLRWRSSGHKKSWLIILGIAAGWAAISRPIDAACYAIPIGVAIAWELRGKSVKTWATCAAIIFAALGPFLLMQIIFDVRVTGHWNQTPYGFSLEQQFPGAGYGLAPMAENLKPVSDQPQFKLMYNSFVVPLMMQRDSGHRLPELWHHRLPMIFDEGLASPLLWILIPVGVIGMFRPRAWLLWTTLPLALLAYAAFSFIPHYVVPFLPALVIVLAGGLWATVSAFPRHRRQIECVLLLGLCTFCVLSWPYIDKLGNQEIIRLPEIATINQKISSEVRPRAIVLFHFSDTIMPNGQERSSDPHCEPVYNSDVSWPDDAPVIKAHDLNKDIADVAGPRDRNRELYEYYSRIAPDRVVYLFDRVPGTGALKRLGTAAELAKATAGR